MDSIEIKTLIDITKTRAIRATQGSRLEQDQYKNFQTLQQTLTSSLYGEKLSDIIN